MLESLKPEHIASESQKEKRFDVKYVFDLENEDKNVKSVDRAFDILFESVYKDYLTQLKK